MAPTPTHRHDARGFSLIEAVIAAGLVAGVLAALAHMLAMSMANGRSASQRSVAMVLASQKLEQLRALAWDDAALAPSPAGTLDTSVDGFVDFVDRSGNPLDAGAMPSGASGPAYTRRWSVEDLPVSPDARVLRVRVTNERSDVRLSTVRARRAP